MPLSSDGLGTTITNLITALSNPSGTGNVVYNTAPSITSALLTLPKIADSAGDQAYRFVPSDLAADRDITLPLLVGNDVMVMEAHSQTLSNKIISGSSNTLTNLPAGALTGIALPANGGTGKTTSDFVGQANKAVVVNGAETGYSFVSPIALPSATQTSLLTLGTGGTITALDPVGRTTGDYARVVDTGGGVLRVQWGAGPTGSSGQVNTSDGAGAWSAAANVTAGSSFISIGANAATTGAINFPSLGAGVVAAVKGSNGSSNYSLISGFGADSYAFGSANVNAKVSGATVTVDANGSTKLTVANALTTSVNDFAIGTAPSGTGAVRLSSTGAIYSKNAAGTQDLFLANFDASNNLIIGANNAQANNTIINAHSATNVQIALGGSTKWTYTLSLTTTANDIAIGTTPATVGIIRVPYVATDTIIGGKDSGGTDRAILSRNGANNLVFGNTAQNAQVLAGTATLYGTTLAGILNTNGSGYALSVNSTLVTVGLPIDMSAGATTAGTILRIPDATARAVVAGTKTLLASSSTEGFLFSDSSYTNQVTTGRIYASGTIGIGLSATNYITIGGSSADVQFPQGTRVNKSAIAVTSTDGGIYENTTAATAGTTVQYSTRIRQRGTAYNSTSTLSETHDWAYEVRPVTVAGATSSAFVVSRSLNGAGYGDTISFASAGATGVLPTSGSINLPHGGSMYFRASGNTNDLPIITTASNAISIGNNTANGSDLFLLSNGGIYMRPVGGSTALQVLTTGVTAFQVFTITKAGLSSTPTDALVMNNTTPATGGTTAQRSPRSRFTGNAWNSTGSVSEAHDWTTELIPLTNAGTTTSSLVFSRQIAGGGYSEMMRLLSSSGIQLPTGSTPANPPAGSVVMWYDGTNLKAKNSAGTAVTWA